MTSFFSDADLIHSYTRAQAILDGFLVPVVDLVPDEPDFAAQAGFRCHVAMTGSVSALVVPTDEEAGFGQDVKGRLWDVLNMARHYRPRPIPAEGATWTFPCIFWLARRTERGASAQRTLTMKAVLAGGDDGEPVVTLMLPEED